MVPVVWTGLATSRRSVATSTVAAPTSGPQAPPLANGYRACDDALPTNVAGVAAHPLHGREARVSANSSAPFGRRKAAATANAIRMTHTRPMRGFSEASRDHSPKRDDRSTARPDGPAGTTSGVSRALVGRQRCAPAGNPSVMPGVAPSGSRVRTFAPREQPG